MQWLAYDTCFYFYLLKEILFQKTLQGLSLSVSMLFPLLHHESTKHFERLSCQRHTQTCPRFNTERSLILV